MRLISKLINTILVKTVTYYCLSNIRVIRGSRRGKTGTGISLFLEWEDGIYCTGGAMSSFENGIVVSLL